MSERIKIVSVFSMIERAREFNWYARDLDKNKFDLYAVFLHPVQPAILEEFRKYGAEVYWIRYRGKKDQVRAIYKLYRLFRRIKPDIVHAQLFDASFAGMLAARLAGISNRICTRHHGILHHSYFPGTVKYDRMISSWSKRIIAPSSAVVRILTEKENVPADKIVLIHHGFDFKEIAFPEKEAVMKMKEKYGIKGFPVIGTVSRFTEWKGLHYTIRAFKNVVAFFPDAILVMTNEGGDYQKQVESELSEIPQSSYRIIAFEPEMPSLFKTFDLFVHIPVDSLSESFGQVYIEALALSVPSVFTKSGIACEIEDIDSLATITPYNDALSIEKAILQFIRDPLPFMNKAKAGKEYIINRYSFSEKIRKTEELYLLLMNK